MPFAFFASSRLLGLVRVSKAPQGQEARCFAALRMTAGGVAGGERREPQIDTDGRRLGGGQEARSFAAPSFAKASERFAQDDSRRRGRE